DIRYTALGDFEEIYADLAEARGVAAARRWYWGQVVRSVPPFLLDSTRWKVIMLTNYLKLALRNLKRQKGYAFINVTGLAVGLACCLLIALYVHDELSFDRYHENADRIVRVTFDFSNPNFSRALAMVGPPVGRDLKAEFPEVVEAARFVENTFLFQRQDDPSIQYQEDNGLFADASALEVFSFNLYRGDPKTALEAPFSVVLTETTARRYFGDDDPMGKVLVHDGNAYTVTGLLDDVPEASHFTFDLLASLSTLDGEAPEFMGEFWALVVNTYLLLDRPEAAAALDARLTGYLERQLGERMNEEGHSYRLATEPLADIYLHSQHHSSLARRGNAATLYVFAGIALFILLIACINFTNLSTARATERAKEVGVRKVVGAQRGQLAVQFFGESMLMTVMALGLALGGAWLVLPAFNAFSGKTLALGGLVSPVFLLILLATALLVGGLAGGYPAVVLSRYRPIAVLRGTVGVTGSGGLLRKGLVVFQFGLSMALIVSTAVVFSQLDFMRNAHLGFDKAQMLTINFSGDETVQQQAEAIKHALLQRADVTGISVSGDIPGAGNLHAGVSVEDSEGTLQSMPWRYVAADFDFIDNYGIELVAGRAFSLDFPTDSAEAMIINEAAVATLGFVSAEQALGASFEHYGQQGEVVGVARDFHLKSLQEEVEPVYMLLDPSRYRYFSLRLDTDNLSRTMAGLEALWGRLAPHRPFEYSFLDESLDRQYRAEEQFGQVVGLFAVLAVFVACLGLFGLAALTTRQRTKEIGLRKVLGASVSGIVVLLTKEVARLVVVAFVLATPVVYLAMDRWLDGFAYRTDLAWW
ncbi:MAG: ABC transporter permease, partial [Bacteroidetes bacterium]|nr:ABC transporter permease [Bacteroidota bacterium]